MMNPQENIEATQKLIKKARLLTDMVQDGIIPNTPKLLDEIETLLTQARSSYNNIVSHQFRHG